MPTVSNYPQGLLALLGLQNFGDTPKEFIGSVSPVLELGALYGANVTTGFAGINTALVANGFNEIPATGANQGRVPQGEIWGVLNFAVALTCEAGVTASFCPALASPALASYRTFLANFVACAAAQTQGVQARITAPLWLPAGSRFGVYVQNLTGVPTVATSIEVNGLIIRVRA